MSEAYSAYSEPFGGIPDVDPRFADPHGVFTDVLADPYLYQHEKVGADNMVNGLLEASRALGRMSSMPVNPTRWAKRSSGDVLSMVFDLESYDGDLNPTLGYMSFPRGDVMGDGGRSSMHIWIGKYHPNDQASLGRVAAIPEKLRSMADSGRLGDPTLSRMQAYENWLFGEGHNHPEHVSSLVEFGQYNDAIMLFDGPEAIDQAYMYSVQYDKAGGGYLHDEATPVNYGIDVVRNREYGSGHTIPAGIWHIPFVHPNITTATNVIKSPALVAGPHVILGAADGPQISPRLTAEREEKIEAKVRLLGELAISTPLRLRLYEGSISRLPASQRDRIYQIANGDLSLPPHMQELAAHRVEQYASASAELARRRQAIINSGFGAAALHSNFGKAEKADPFARRNHAAVLLGKLYVQAAVNKSTDLVDEHSATDSVISVSHYRSHNGSYVPSALAHTLAA